MGLRFCVSSKSPDTAVPVEKGIHVGNKDLDHSGNVYSAFVLFALRLFVKNQTSSLPLHWRQDQGCYVFFFTLMNLEKIRAYSKIFKPLTQRNVLMSHPLQLSCKCSSCNWFHTPGERTEKNIFSMSYMYQSLAGCASNLSSFNPNEQPMKWELLSVFQN